MNLISAGLHFVIWCGYTSMLYLNFSNIEELIFFDKPLQNTLPVNLFGLFEQWRLAKRMPFLKELGKNAVLDLLNNLTDEHIEILEQYFGEKIIVERLNYSIALNIKVPLSDISICNELCNIEGFNNFGTWRDDQHLYISFWR